MKSITETAIELMMKDFLSVFDKLIEVDDSGHRLKNYVNHDANSARYSFYTYTQVDIIGCVSLLISSRSQCHLCCSLNQIEITNNIKSFDYWSYSTDYRLPLAASVGHYTEKEANLLVPNWTTPIISALEEFIEIRVNNTKVITGKNRQNIQTIIDHIRAFQCR